MSRISARTLRRVGAAIGGSAAIAASGLKLYTEFLVRRAEGRYPPRGEFLTVEGLRLHCVASGTGRPVVLVHGDGGSTYDWTLSVFDRIARGYRVVAFDRPGFGYSARPRDGASPLVQARLIRGAVREMGLDRPALIGHSRGGQVVLAYALEYPDEVAGVVDLAGGVFFDEPWGPLRNRLLLAPVLGPLLANTVFVPFGRSLVEAALDWVFAPEGPIPPGYLDAYAAMLLRPGSLRAHADDQVNAAPVVKRLIPRYGELRVPLVILNGTEDRSTPVEHARRLMETVAGSEIIELQGAGHEIMFLHPDRVVDAIASVFERGAPC